MGARMTGRVRVPDEIVEAARSAGEADGRSAEGQIAHWVRLGRVMERSGLYTHLQITDLLAHDRVPVPENPSS
jgi:hypothetical protein